MQAISTRKWDDLLGSVCAQLGMATNGLSGKQLAPYLRWSISHTYRGDTVCFLVPAAKPKFWLANLSLYRQTGVMSSQYEPGVWLVEIDTSRPFFDVRSAYGLFHGMTLCGLFSLETRHEGTEAKAKETGRPTGSDTCRDSRTVSGDPRQLVTDDQATSRQALSSHSMVSA